MAQNSKRQSGKSERKSYRNFSSDTACLELVDSIKKLAELELTDEYLTYDELLYKVKRWWCRYYKRPYKDPLLDSYTFEELLFEYFEVNREIVDSAAVPATQEMPQEEHDWAAEEEARELLEEAEKRATPESDTIVEEAIGISDDEWANQHIAKVLTNPTANEVDNEDGDISATFEV